MKLSIWLLAISLLPCLVWSSPCTDTCDTQHTTGLEIEFCGTDGVNHKTHTSAVVDCYLACDVHVNYPGTCSCPNSCSADYGWGECKTIVNTTDTECDCVVTRDGPDCSLVGCPAHLCSGHGSCTVEWLFPDRCQCDPGWTGVDCSVPEPGIYHAPYGVIFSQSVYMNDTRGDAHPLFNLSHVARIYINVEPADLVKLLSPSNMWNQSYVNSTLAYENGLEYITLTDVAFRLNAGYSRRAIKKDWTLDFALFDVTQNLMGVESIVLKGAEGGDSMLREQLYNDMLRAAEVPAQRTSFAQVWINRIFQGLYLVQEEIDDAFAISRFNDVNGDLYKMNGEVYLTYPSNDHTYYEQATGTKGSWTYKVYEKTQGTGDYSDLVSILAIIDNGTDADLSNAFNVDQLLRQAAVEALLLAGDSFVASGTNYFMYRTQRYATQMWQMIPHDFDQIFSATQSKDVWSYLRAKQSVSPLLRRVLAQPAWNTTFIDHFRLLMDKVYGGGRASGVISPSERYTRLLNFTAGMIAQDKYWLMSNGLSDASSYRIEAEQLIAALPDRATAVIEQLGPIPTCTARCDAAAIDGIFITFCGTDGETHTTHMSATGDCYLACGVSVRYPGICGCPNGCFADMKQGTCVTNGNHSECVCAVDRDGPDCSSVGCPANTCNGHGTCVVGGITADYCRCDAGWTGNDCQVLQLPGTEQAPYGTIYDNIDLYLNDTYGDYHPLFNLSLMARIYIATNPEDLATLLNPVNMWNQSWVNAAVFYQNGVGDEALGDCALTLAPGYSRRNLKKDWTIDFDVFSPGQSLKGVERIVLKGAAKGDALLRELFYTDMLRASGVVAQRSTWAQVWVNQIFQGLYLVQEEIDDALVKSRFNDVDGDLYKMNGEVDLTFPSTDPAYYEQATSSEGGWTYKVYEKAQGTGNFSDLVAFLSILNNTSDAELQTKLSAIYDINSWLRQSVVEAFLLTGDSFLSASTNYYLYRHESSPIANQWSMIPHNYRLLFMRDAELDIYSFLRQRASKSPLVARLLDVKGFNETFQNYFRTFVNKIYGSGLNAGVMTPAQRYDKFFNFTWAMIQEDKFWLLSNGLTNYAPYQTSAYFVINYLPLRTGDVERQISGWSTSESDSGLSTAAKWGIGIAVVVFLGVIMYCCWSRSRQAQYADATQRLGGTDEAEPIGFGNTSSSSKQKYGGDYQSGSGRA